MLLMWVVIVVGVARRASAGLICHYLLEGTLDSRAIIATLRYIIFLFDLLHLALRPVLNDIIFVGIGISLLGIVIASIQVAVEVGLAEFDLDVWGAISALIEELRQDGVQVQLLAIVHFGLTVDIIV